MPVVLHCVITYEPSTSQLKSTIDQLRIVDGSVVFDNSEVDATRERIRKTCQSARLTYLGGQGNIGTAAALNYVALEARATGSEWIHYLDQDSRLTEAYMPALESCIHHAESEPMWAAIGSRIRTANRREPRLAQTRFQPTKRVIASGTLYRTSAVIDAGGFDVDMFLDLVDFEFCFRTRSLGCQVLYDNEREIFHAVGMNGKIFASRVFVTEHPIWRRQLMWRNSIVLVRRYYGAFPTECARHLGGRVAETLLGSLRFRSPAYLTAAMRGFRQGLNQTALRRAWI